MTRQFNMRIRNTVLEEVKAVAAVDGVNKSQKAFLLMQDTLMMKKGLCIATHGPFGNSHMLCPCPRHVLNLKGKSKREIDLARDVEGLYKGQCISLKKGRGSSGLKCACPEHYENGRCHRAK